MDILVLVWDWLILRPLAQAPRLLAVPLEASMPPGAAGALAIILFAAAVASNSIDGVLELQVRERYGACRSRG